MDEKLKELLHRKPSKWGNVSVKTFEKDLNLLTSTIQNYEKAIAELDELCLDFKNGTIGEMTDSFLVDEVLSVLENLKVKN